MPGLHRSRVNKSSLATRARASGSGSHGGARDSPEFDEDFDAAALPSERGDSENPPPPKRAKSLVVKTVSGSCNNQKPPVHSSLVSGTRDSGPDIGLKSGDWSGLTSPPTVLEPQALQPSNFGGGTTNSQPGDLHTATELSRVPRARRPVPATDALQSSKHAKRLCSRSELLDWHPPVELDDHAALVDYAGVLPSRPQVLSPAIPVGPDGTGVRCIQRSVAAEDRLASSSCALRRRISRKRPPIYCEGVAMKRCKLDTG